MECAAWRLADHLADVGRYAEAERIVRTALARAPDDVALLTMLGYLLRMQDRHLDALAVCDAAVALAPDRGDAHAQRAWVLIGIHRSAQAIEAATEAVRLGPHLADRHEVLAQALLQDDRAGEARVSAREALRLAPRSASALLTLAEIERFAGNADAATVAVRQAMAIDPVSTRGRRILALLDADRGVVRRSMRTLAEVARDQAADPDLYALVWPVRWVVTALRWWLPGGAAVAAVAGLASPTPASRFAAGLTCAVTAAFVLRVLVPAGHLPWRALRRSPPLVRRSLAAGLAVVAAALGLLAGYAAGGPLVLPILAVTTAPMLWTCMMLERLGHTLNDAGSREALRGWRREFLEVLGAIRAWPAETRRELHAAWHAGDAGDAGDADELEQKRRSK